MEALSIESTKKAIRYALKTNVPINLEGPPGIGKSSIMYQLAKELGVPCGTLIASLCDPTDFGGFPVVVNGRLERVPLGTIRDLSEKGGILFVDEITTAPPAIQAALLRGILDRVFGDTKLHADTRIVCACNPPDQASGGYEMSLPLISRLARIKLVPTLEEVQNYFYAIGADASPLRALGSDLAATLEADPGLLQLDPPPGAQQTGRAWGNPRNWERALTLIAGALDAGEDDSGEIVGVALAGNVGPDAGSAYMAIRKVRHRLPKVGDIVKDPHNALLPSDAATGVASLGVLAQVAQADPCPAWVYANRLQDEIRIAATRALFRYPLEQGGKKSKWYPDASKARIKLLGSAGKLAAN